jgi:YbbR domain-containing protein
MIQNKVKQIDFGLLIFSLLVALALWMNVKSERMEIRHFYPFIELQNQPMHLVIQSQYPKTLDVVIQGQATALNGIQPDLISAIADIRGLHEGKNTFRLAVEKNVVLPKVLRGRVEVVRIIPETLEIETEPIKNTKDSSK